MQNNLRLHFQNCRCGIVLLFAIEDLYFFYKCLNKNLTVNSVISFVQKQTVSKNLSENAERSHHCKNSQQRQIQMVYNIDLVLLRHILRFLKNPKKGFVILSVLICHLNFSQLFTATSWLPSAFSINVFVTIVLSFSPKYLDCMNVSIL